MENGEPFKFTTKPVTAVIDTDVTVIVQKKACLGCKKLYGFAESKGECSVLKFISNGFIMEQLPTKLPVIYVITTFVRLL